MQPRDAPSDTRSKYRVEALAKGLAVLSLFSERQTSLMLKQICEATAMPMATAFRVIATLEEDGYLERLPDGSYRPSVAVLTLGYSALSGLDLVDHSQLLLRDLAQSTNETVNVGSLVGDRVLYLVRIRNADLVTANIQVGSTLPAVHTSMGKILLSELDPIDLKQRLDPASFGDGTGPNAVRTIEQLEKTFATIRRQGYAIQDQEVAHGLRSIACPIRGKDGTIVAAANVAVQASQYTTTEMVRRFRSPLRETCDEVTRRLSLV
ncbi:IclR family transcriptional regulator [Phytohabitans kaempferiae]|uniref:IclR family transcriptional regulator n=1 Tax=Phytohabitans kaempferiae TaxID=1620943 RepID=A0ABV6M628_9ACTN